MSFLRLVEIKATNLPNVEKVGKSDPYASVQYKGIVSFHNVVIEEWFGNQFNQP